MDENKVKEESLDASAIAAWLRESAGFNRAKREWSEQMKLVDSFEKEANKKIIKSGILFGSVVCIIGCMIAINVTKALEGQSDNNDDDSSDETIEFE